MHFDNGRDTFKTAGEYQTAAQYWRERENKTVVIQRFWRGFSARSRVWALREGKWAQQEKEMEATAEEEGKKGRQRQREMQRRMNPSTIQDFEASLHSNLGCDAIGKGRGSGGGRGGETTHATSKRLNK